MQLSITHLIYLNKMKVVDLFSGCGGLSLGFQKAGFEVVAAFDNWEEAINVYQKNFQHPIFNIDLKNVAESVEKISDFAPDVIVGGPPCQDFSSAGKRNEDNGRGDLTVAYAQIISKIKPQWFLMENVERILKTNKLIQAKQLFRETGYGLTQMVLNASLCGVPQKRKRFILIGKLNESDDFLQHYLTEKQSEKEMTLFDYFGNSLGIEYYYRHPRSYVRRGVFSIYEPSPTIRGVNRPMPKGYQKHTGDPVENLDGIRALTTKERSMIQTFPEDFVFSGSKTDIEQMIGNAVPVNLAKFVATAILEFIENPNKNENKQLALF